MNTGKIIVACIGAVICFCLMNFTMRLLIKLNLNINSGQEDSLKFRLKVTKPAIILLVIFIAFNYGVLFLPLSFGLKGSLILSKELFPFTIWVSVVLLGTLPAIVFNLFFYRKS